MGHLFRTQTLSRAQLAGPVRLSEYAQGKTLSALQRDQGPVRLSQLQPVVAAPDPSRDAFERTPHQRR